MLVSHDTNYLCIYKELNGAKELPFSLIPKKLEWKIVLQIQSRYSHNFMFQHIPIHDLSVSIPFIRLSGSPIDFGIKGMKTMLVNGTSCLIEMNKVPTF